MQGALCYTVKAKRARVTLLSAQGCSTGDIARRVGYTVQRVRKIIHRFNAGRIEAIEWSTRSGKRGRPGTYSEEVVQGITKTAMSPPQPRGPFVWAPDGSRNCRNRLAVQTDRTR